MLRRVQWDSNIWNPESTILFADIDGSIYIKGHMFSSAIQSHMAYLFVCLFVLPYSYRWERILSCGYHVTATCGCWEPSSGPL